MRESQSGFLTKRNFFCCPYYWRKCQLAANPAIAIATVAATVTASAAFAAASTAAVTAVVATADAEMTVAVLGSQHQLSPLSPLLLSSTKRDRPSDVPFDQASK